MSNIQEFIEFWQQNENLPKHENDTARLLWLAHKRANAALHAAENETIRFLRPVKGSKGALSVAFHPGSESEVADIADRIAGAEKQIAEVEGEISEFMELAGGPSLLPIQKEVNHEKGIISTAIVGARKVRQVEERRLRGKVGRLAGEDEIAASPLVVAAGEHEARTLAEHESKADELRERSVRAYSIAAKYEKKAI